MEERWKPLIYGKLDLRDHLMVSDQGRIWSLYSHRLLKPNKSKKGYWIVSTTNGSRDKHIVIKIHRAVAFMFVDGYKEGLVVNHKDGNKENCLWTNLEWISAAANFDHALKNGLIPWNKRVKCNETQEIFPSLASAARWCGLTESAGSFREYFANPKRHTAGKHPITGEKLTWSFV